MSATPTFRRVVLIAVVSSLVMLSGAGPAAAWEFVTGPPRRSEVGWSIYKVPGVDGPHVVNLGVVTGFCYGEPPPIPGPATVIERPVSAAHPRPAAIITVRQILPEPTEVKGKVKPGEPIPACAGIGSSFEKRVRLKRPVDGMVFYDGSFDPPKLVRLPGSR